MRVHEETTKILVNGTIIDFETIGEFDKRFSDHRQYAYILPVIFGTLEENKMKIFYVENEDEISELLEQIKSSLNELKEPFWAFNRRFEQGIIINQLGLNIEMQELQARRYESKKSVVKELNIPNFGDPFHDNGYLAMQAWLAGDVEECVKHNRACLLKEALICVQRFGIN
ncbi:MAG: hypothetical protein ACTSX4_05130 [Candidatus Helarchaeota archaeon]